MIQTLSDIDAPHRTPNGSALSRGTTPSTSAIPSLSTDDGHRILVAALDLLKQSEGLLEALDATTYTHRVEIAFNGCIGGHYRHCLDHFHSLLRGQEKSWIDYDHRERDRRMETDLAFALQTTREVRARFQQISVDDLQQPVMARCEVSYDHGESPSTPSTFGRELVYAIAHAIHHFALISIVARLQGAVLPPDFGVAPSTVAHLKSQKNSATDSSVARS